MGVAPVMTGKAFQSTLSVRRATHRTDHPDRHQRISIHALRKESDSASMQSEED